MADSPTLYDDSGFYNLVHGDFSAPKCWRFTEVKSSVDGASSNLAFASEFYDAGMEQWRLNGLISR